MNAGRRSWLKRGGFALLGRGLIGELYPSQVQKARDVLRAPSARSGAG